MRCRMPGVLVVSLAAALWAGEAVAAVPSAPTGTYQYDIEQETYGKIGTHTATFEYDGRDLIVSTAVRIEVKLLYLTIYTFVSDGREVWRDGRLVEFETTTDDNGTRFAVKAWAEGDKFVIEGQEGRVVTDGAMFTTHAWNPAVLGTPVLMEPTSGKLYKVGISEGGPDEVGVHEETVRARKYVIEGDIQGGLWYAEDGTWLKMDFIKYGTHVRIKLSSVTS